MINRKSRIMERQTRGGAADGGYGSYDFEYPPYLQNEYLENYDCSPSDFANMVNDEVFECSISKSQKNEKYKLWFGKYKGELLHTLTDIPYLHFLCDTQRKTNPKLVGQALLRIDEIYGN
jgi:hypothetical protein